MSTPVKIIVNSFTSKYTNAPNPITAFTYPVTGVNLNITYNGLTGIPVDSGDYNVSLDVLDSGYYAEQVITGIYSIVGRLKTQSYALGWGRSNTLNANGPNYGYAPSGLVGVEKIVCGQDFCVALMDNNSIITWGSGNSYGQQSIPYINNYIKDIAVSDTTTFIIDYSGRVTGCGYLFNTFGNGYSGSRPTLTGISGVAAANYYMVAIPSNNTRSLTGWGDRSEALFNFSGGFYLTGITQVSATNLAYVALNNQNKVTGWGLNYFDQLSWTTGENQNIQKISCSDISTVFLYNNKQITGYGSLIDANDNLVPFTIDNPNIQGHVLDVSVSNTHALLILDEKIAPPVVPVPPPVCTGIVYA